MKDFKKLPINIMSTITTCKIGQSSCHEFVILKFLINCRWWYSNFRKYLIPGDDKCSHYDLNTNNSTIVIIKRKYYDNICLKKLIGYSSLVTSILGNCLCKCFSISSKSDKNTNAFVVLHVIAFDTI